MPTLPVSFKHVLLQLETERLVLRPPRLEDAEALLDFVGDGATMRPIGSEPGGIEVAVEHLERWLRRWEVNDMGPFLVVHRAKGNVVGRVGPLVWSSATWETAALADAGGDAEIELGWAIRSAYWGRGYAPEAARAVRQWVYDARSVERLISLIDPVNARSARVAEKLDAEPTETVELFDGSLATIWVHPR
jgi:RimJ/RimL family protein N-acetyltransferase